ncbi:MAG: alkene reductase [Desulfuromonadaceae bacterium]|nr:alkene reductase [Desulfuromonadaceae bacterium]MDD2855302.1 alkene reductase [Desulfuromonadaceae bacterium]
MKLFNLVRLGNIDIKNRVVMSPMTRNRATGNIPNKLMAEYYSQRSGAGLIITEGTSPSPDGLGYPRIPGIFSYEQIKGWQLVTEAVHNNSGKIFIQLMHTGRIGNSLNLPAEAEIIAPSEVVANGNIYTDSKGEQPYGKPRNMTRDDISNVLNEYVQAAKNSILAGFDGVEIHAANGYLINQFLDPASNIRTDEFGGDNAARNRFALDVTAAVADAIGKGRVGVRISPYGVFNDMSGNYEGIAEQYSTLAANLGKLEIAYIHLVDHSAMGAPKPEPATVELICSEFKKSGGGAVILSGGYDRDQAESDLQSGRADLIAFGRPFIANPDLVKRMLDNSALNPVDMSTFYTSEATGYTDYPTYIP